MNTTTETVKQRTEWLDNFNEGHQAVRLALEAIAGHAATLREAGLDGIADRLTGPLILAREGVAVMDGAVSQMVNEQVKASFDQIGETFKALLGAAIETTSTGQD